jgi:tetratricopeptide (TPR) repeat protein
MHRIGETFAGTAKIVDVRKGGMGVVYICDGSVGNLDGVFAVKTWLDIEQGLRASLGNDSIRANAAALRRSFVDEAMLALDLPAHPNIIETYAVLRHHGIPYLQMEYVDGPSLRARLQRDPLDLETALTTAADIVRGLDAAYETCGLVHRDVKPENVLYALDGTAKIGDFGLSVALAREAAERAGSPNVAAASAQIVGTMGYMAPEQLIDAGEPDVRSDIYAFGVVLYEMLTGNVPFAAFSVEETLTAIASAVPPPITRADIPAELHSLVARCLAKRRDERFADYDAISDELESIADSLSIDLPSSYVEPRSEAYTLFRKAMGLMNLGRSRDALDLLERNDYQRFDHPDLFFAAGTALGNLGEHEKALEALDHTLRSESPNAHRAIFNQANALAALGRHEYAMQGYICAMLTKPDYAEPVIGLANVALDIGQYDEALEATQRALRLVPDSPTAWAIRAIAFQRQGESAAAVDAVRQGRAACGESPDGLRNFATALHHLGAHAEAAKLALRCIEVSDMLDTDSLGELFVIIVAADDDALARKAVRSASRLPAFQELAATLDIEVVHQMMVDELMRAGDSRAALDVANREMEQRPESIMTILRKARLLSDSKEYDDALAAIHEALERMPESIDARSELALVYMRMKRADDALAALDDVLLRDPTRYEALVNRASVLMELGRYDEALAAAEEALATGNDDAALVLLKGRTLRLAGRTTAAEDWLRPAVEARPTHTELWNERALALLDLRRYDDTLRCLGKIVELEPKNARAWHNRGDTLLRMGDHREALQCFMNAVTLDPTAAPAWTGVGTIHLLLHEYEEAIVYLDKALAADPEFDVARSNRIIAEARLQIRRGVERLGGDEEEMVAELEETLRERGVNISLRLDRIGDLKGGPQTELPAQPSREHDQRRETAFALSEDGRMEEAIMLFKRIVQDVPSDYAAWHALGVCHSNLGRHAESLPFFDQALRVKPPEAKLPETLNSKGEALRQLGRFHDAITLYDEALRIDPQHDLAWNNKGLCFRSLGRREEAKICYRRALDINPHSWRALANHATVDVEQGDRSHAKKMLKALEKMNVDDPMFRLGIAALYYNLGKKRYARREIAAAERADPHNPEIIRVARIING